jgi:hypothetical protein
MGSQSLVMQHEPPATVQNANADVWQLIQALVLGRLPSDRILELFYWGQKPGVLELVRSMLDLRAENTATLAAFFSIADSKTVKIDVDAAGRVILSSPGVTDSAAIAKAAEVTAAAFSKSEKSQQARNALSA